MKNLNITLLFDYYGDYLGEKQRELFDLYYNQDLSLSEIAENAGITRQGVRDFIKRTEQHLIELEEKLHIFQKSTELRRVAADVKNGKAGLDDLLEFIDNF